MKVILLVILISFIITIIEEIQEYLEEKALEKEYTLFELYLRGVNENDKRN